MKRIFKFLFILGFILSAIGFVRISYYQAKAALAQHLMQGAWQQQLDKKHSKNSTEDLSPIKPWSWADTWPVLELRLPSISSNHLVLKDSSGQSLAFGPGILNPENYPGDIGNSFIAAHRDTHFSNITELKINDPVEIIDRFGQQTKFSIDIIKIIDSRIEQPEFISNERRVTLVTCYRFDESQSNSPFRYLVSAVLVN